MTTTAEKYRPTVRYSPIFRDFVENIHETTTLDRNQIMRLALYLLRNSNEGIQILEHFKKGDVTLPPSLWDIEDPLSHELWYGEGFNPKKLEDREGDDVIKKIKMSSIYGKNIDRNNDNIEVTKDPNTGTIKIKVIK